MKILDAIKSKAFWGGVLTTIGGVLAGALTVPEAIIQLVHLIGG